MHTIASATAHRTRLCSRGLLTHRERLLYSLRPRGATPNVVPTPPPPPVVCPELPQRSAVPQTTMGSLCTTFCCPRGAVKRLGGSGRASEPLFGLGGTGMAVYIFVDHFQSCPTHPPCTTNVLSNDWIRSDRIFSGPN